MNIVKATQRYENWLARHLTLLDRDLNLKHEQMRLAVFPFLRATFYRWAQIWAEAVGEAARAPSVLAVGDLHVENFGTWRDIEGRLIWGINDFDEAWPMPYTNDLIRLATSALLAEMPCGQKAGIGAILKGYRDGVEAAGRAFVLAENHPVLRQMAVARLHAPERYWEKLHALPDVTGEPPAGAMKQGRAHRIRRWHGRLAWRIAGPRSQSAGSFGLRLGRAGRRLRADSLSGNRRLRGALPRSVRPPAEALDRAAAGAGLLAHRAGFLAGESR